MIGLINESALAAAKKRRARLERDDPENQEGLVQAIPPSVEFVDIHNMYTLPESRWRGGRGEKVRCAQCQRTIHRNGFTAKLSDGRLALLGSSCGADAFGHSWDVATRLHKADVRSARFEVDLLEVQAPRYRKLFEALPRWKAGCLTLSRTMQHFRSDLPELYYALEGACNSQRGELTAIRFVEDIAGEAQKRQGSSGKEGADDKVEKKAMEQVVHIVQGGQLFEKCNPAADLERAMKSLREFLSFAATYQFETGWEDLRQLHATLNRRLPRLRRVVDVWRGVDRFFLAANLAPIAAWATHDRSVPGSYTAQGRAIVHVGTGRRAEIRGSLPALDRTVLELLPFADEVEEKAAEAFMV